MVEIMEKRNIWSFKIHWYILVLLLVLLAISLASNVYLYYGVIKPLKEQEDEKKTEAGWGHVIQSGMEWMEIDIIPGLSPGPGTKFNVSLWGKLWEPYIGFSTYTFYFKLYERSEQSDRYPDTPVVEKLVSENKSENAMYVYFDSGNLTVTAPSARGIYIYKLCFGTETETWKTYEFPIFVCYTLDG